eukprot:TRINITY_DN9800_c0_g1_i1.p1 TRINITY_DN9800_c0_g1~~TRINITY_DN9800_c0_g1_i1.p1  ORF type:complete len:487 (+),score=78.48 TRINITY_DN9800_c0_g1_i1:71-1531(+)
MSKRYSFPGPESGDRGAKGFRTLKYVCFVFRAEFELNGSPGGQGMALGDVDGDGQIELCVGSVDGTLCVFKHANNKPWAVATKLGTILCVEVIGLAGGERNIAVLSAEGWCRLLSVSQQGDIVESGGLKRLPRNITNMEFCTVIPTTENSCHTHVALGGLDRTVYLYEIKPSEEGEYCFVLLAVYRVDFAVTSLAVHKTKDNTFILVGLSNSSYAMIHVWRDAHGHRFNWSSDSVQYYYADKDDHIIRVVAGEGVERSYLACKGKNMAIVTQDGGVMWMDTETAVGAPASLFARNPDTATHPLGLSPMEHTFSRHKWTAPVQLMEMVINGVSFLESEGGPSLCLCTWGGDIYFIDGQRDAVRFSMHEPVRSFLQGKFSVSANDVKTCIFCATFDGQIIMFSDIQNELGAVKNSQVTDSIDDMTDEEPETWQSRVHHLEADLKQRRDTAKRVRSVLYDITPADITCLESYKSILEARLSTRPLDPLD